MVRWLWYVFPPRPATVRFRLGLIFTPDSPCASSLQLLRYARKHSHHLVALIPQVCTFNESCHLRNVLSLTSPARTEGSYSSPMLLCDRHTLLDHPSCPGASVCLLGPLPAVMCSLNNYYDPCRLHPIRYIIFCRRRFILSLALVLASKRRNVQLRMEIRGVSWLELGREGDKHAFCSWVLPVDDLCP